MPEHPLIAHAWWIATERERMGFVWAGDGEKDPRYAGGGRVAWGRASDNGLYVLDVEVDQDWRSISDDQWDLCYPHAGHPPRLPDDYKKSSS